MEPNLSSVPSSSRLKGALRWSQAEDAAARIDVLKYQVDAAGRKGALKSDLVKGLSELESIRQFINDGILLSNQDYLKGGSKDHLLQSALEKGLSDLDNVKADLVHALSQQQKYEAPKSQRTPSAQGARQAPPSGPAPPPRAPSGSSMSNQRRSLFNRHASNINLASTQKATPQPTGMQPGNASRPMSAPIRKGSTDPNINSNTSLKATVPVNKSPAARPQSQHDQATPPPPSASEWGKYQDWAQNVLNRVQSRKMQQKKDTFFKGLQEDGKDKDQYEEEIRSDDDDDDDDDGGEEDGLGRHDRMARSAREGRPPQPSFTAGIPRARPLSATFGRTQSGGGGPTTAATAGMSKAARPESANFSQQRTPSQTQQPAPTGTSNARNRPTTAGMSVRSEPVSAAASAGQNGKLHPQAQALREQGNIFFQQKKYKESAEAYGKAIQQYEPNSDTLYCNRAAAYLMLNKCEEALADAQHAVELDPTHVKAHWRAAKACLYLGRSEMAKQLYTTAHKLAGVQTEADAIAAEMKAVDLAEKCRRCLRLREYADAQKAADQLLEIFPVNGPCSGPWVCLKSESLLYTDAHEAGTLLTTLCTEDPTNAEAWLIRGKALFYAAHDAISTTSALTYLNKARDMDVGKASIVVLNGVPGTTPSFLSTVAGRAATLINTIENFSKLRDAGNNAYAAGKWVEAYDAYTRCLNVDACNSSLKAIILCNRAAVSIQCEKWREAIEDVNASIAFNGSNAKAYTRRARIHQHNADYDDAVRDLQTAVQMYPSAENQERLQQALEQQKAQQRAQQQKSANASASNAQSRAGSYRFFGTSHEGFRMPRPSTAGARAQSSTGGTPGGGSSYSSFFSRAGASSSSNYSTQPPKPAGPSTTYHYQMLSITKLADDKAVTKAYREAALKWHPDKWASESADKRATAEATFKEINVAYSVLKDPIKRRQYDMGVPVV